MMPFLCRIGLHRRYKYLPKVSGVLGEISIACKRCGYGLRYFQGTWDIEPIEVQESIKEQAQIEFGNILEDLKSIDNPIHQMEIAISIMGSRFTPKELLLLNNKLNYLKEISQESY